MATKQEMADVAINTGFLRCRAGTTDEGYAFSVRLSEIENHQELMAARSGMLRPTGDTRIKTKSGEFHVLKISHADLCWVIDQASKVRVGLPVS